MTKRIWVVLTVVGMAVSCGQAAFADGKLPRIKILATGGTIAGAGATSTATTHYAVAVTAVETRISNVPELSKIATVTGELVAQIASESMTTEIWLKLANRVNALLAQDDVDGVVITHGTDTIEETAYN
jgi:L-asparaginase